jgi:hypothetical protein
LLAGVVRPEEAAQPVELDRQVGLLDPVPGLGGEVVARVLVEQLLVPLTRQGPGVVRHGVVAAFDDRGGREARDGVGGTVKHVAAARPAVEPVGDLLGLARVRGGQVVHEPVHDVPDLVLPAGELAQDRGEMIEAG